MNIVPNESDVKPFVHPTIEEILAQQRMMLENLNELMKHMAQPMWYIQPKEDKE